MQVQPIGDMYANHKELTLRGIILGALITVIFTASNVYLGLKVGLTFASSIPAAVISMAVLKFAKDSNILENNIVQTQASAAGTLSSIIFVLPALLMLGYWTGFPFWQTTILCIAGGILGVIFTIPLRYAMVVNSDLPYPEGVAAAEILRAGEQDTSDDTPAQSDASTGAKDIVIGGALSGIVAFLTGGLRVLADSAGYWFKAGSAITQLPMGFSLALLGAGYLVGVAGGIAILLGIIIAWGAAVPILTSMTPQPSDVEMSAFAMKIWKENVRFIGAGTIGVAAIWTLLTLMKPMIEGLKISMQALKGGNSSNLSRMEQDLSPKVMIGWTVVMTLLLAVSFYQFVADASLPAGLAWLLVLVCTAVTFIIGFLVAAACGYMAGLVGSSSSPISGIGIISIVVISLILLLVGNAYPQLLTTGDGKFVTALALFCGSAVLCVATISNDNLQDLKTGYLVKATPWRQQIALMIGVVVGALVISPILELLYKAYGFTGALPRPDMDASQALGAPQATLMTTIAKGIFAHNLNWDFILIGVLIGAVLIVADTLLRKTSAGKYSLPVLAVGMGIYLPPTINMPIFIGSVLAWWIKNHITKNSAAAQRERNLKLAERKGTLFAAGLIVGESLIGVIMAFIIAASVTTGGSDAPLALKLANWDNIAQWLGLLAFILAIVILARRVLSSAKTSA
ncbi:OPT family oligopeptide transporter [Moraxella osloensis]|uniref:Oligopeptide transporter, OPT family n=1 Tax=Faucicola osloensis TaxID=34062 RepID=A0A378QB78_FAUOS|nr:oligopeptide transporter, OPT family [Moraxella osloensis]QPT42256.1 oligopeptide transporter, OPT family [Moraxella osloensis]STY97895.1 oligopeptide transporter, OPT family [Moraxella osloensis]